MTNNGLKRKKDRKALIICLFLVCLRAVYLSGLFFFLDFNSQTAIKLLICLATACLYTIVVYLTLGTSEPLFLIAAFNPFLPFQNPFPFLIQMTAIVLSLLLKHKISQKVAMIVVFLMMAMVVGFCGFFAYYSVVSAAAFMCVIVYLLGFGPNDTGRFLSTVSLIGCAAGYILGVLSTSKTEFLQEYLYLQKDSSLNLTSLIVFVICVCVFVALLVLFRKAQKQNKIGASPAKALDKKKQKHHSTNGLLGLFLIVMMLTAGFDLLLQKGGMPTWLFVGTVYILFILSRLNDRFALYILRVINSFYEKHVIWCVLIFAIYFLSAFFLCSRNDLFAVANDYLDLW